MTRVLSDDFIAHRDRMAALLKEEPLSFGELIDLMGISRGFATALIMSLRQSDLVLRRHMGQRRVYVWVGPEEQEAAE